MIKAGKMNESVSKGYITDYIDSDELHRIMSYTKEFGSFEDYRQIGNMTIETRTVKRYNHIGPYGAVDPSSRYWKFINTSAGWEVVEVSSDGKKIGKPFKIKVGKMNESYSDKEKSIIHNLWFENLEKVMGYSKQIADNLRKNKYGYEAYTDKTYDTWKSLLIKAGIKIPSSMNESVSGRWAQVDLHAEDEYKYCGNGGRSWVTADSGHVDTWESKEAAIADGKKNYKPNYKYGRDWDVVQL